MVPFSKAKELLGASPVYSLSDVERVFGVKYSSQEWGRLAHNIPFTEEVLAACDGTHMLFPGFPLSLLDIRTKCPSEFHKNTNGWYAKTQETFSRDYLPIGWNLLRMDPVADSHGKTEVEQHSLLLLDEEVPLATTVAFAAMVHFKATGKRLFERGHVRTSDINAGGSRVCIGDFDPAGLVICCYWDSLRDTHLGLSSAKKS